MLSRAQRSAAIVVSLAVATPAAPFFYATPALAAPKAPSIGEELTGEAKMHYDTGVRLARRGDWNGARSSFLAAYEASGNPRVLFNVAVCERELGRYAAAVKAFQRELEEGAGRIPESEVEDVRAAIHSLQKLLAKLTIKVEQAGAEVFIDGEKVGVSPLPNPVTVQVGERRIRATKPGFSATVESIHVAAGSSQTLSLELAPAVRTARVEVVVDGPANAIVKIDGKSVGPAPYKGNITVSAEPHEFSAIAPGYASASQSLIVREGEPLRVRLALDELQKQGRLVVATQPEDATIEIDGRVVGATHWEGPLKAGSHQIVARKPGYYDWTYDVEVQPGGLRTVTADLNVDRDTSFVPWLIGSLVVAGGSAVALYFILRPNDEKPVRGTLSPGYVPTAALRF